MRERTGYWTWMNNAGLTRSQDKKRIMEIQIYFTKPKYNPQKNSFKRNQNPSRYHNSITNLKVSNTSQNRSWVQNPHIKIRPTTT